MAKAKEKAIETTKENNFGKQKKELIKEKRKKEKPEQIISLGTTKDSGGSVLANKQVETLEALLKAYEARLNSNETLEQRWRRYPDPQSEARQLELYQRLLGATQALEEKLSQTPHPKTKPKESKIEPEGWEFDQPKSLTPSEDKAHSIEILPRET